MNRAPSKPAFGYRLKVPLALTTVALTSGVLVAATTYMLVDRHVETNAVAETRRLADTLARALAPHVLRNDVWQAFQTMRAATQPSDDADTAQAVRVVALDARGHVFASPSPREHPLGLHLSALPAPLALAARRVLDSAPPATSRVEITDTGMLILGTPIVGDEDVLLGVVLASHPRALTDAQRGSVIRQLVFLGALAMLVVALAGGVIGLRMTAPLARLRAIMQSAPRRGVDEASDTRQALEEICAQRDEVGELGRSFASMMAQITAKQELERHMLEAERLASIGQLAAGIAHEVNNPLGGMLAAIQNRRLRGSLDEGTSRTLALLERGLSQIHDTVQALLNEARSERHPLTAADLRDLELLLRPEADHLRCQLAWRADPPGSSLPAVPVRQVMLNLSLNAIAAAGSGGRVSVWTDETAHAWQVWVGNSGTPLDAAKLATLTHGGDRTAQGRLGLGLWITARILHTAGGRLTLAAPQPPLTTVLVASFRLRESALPAATAAEDPA